MVTTGGTGIAERDVTPEATFRAVCERLLEGVAERMRITKVRRRPRSPRSAGESGGVSGKVPDLESARQPCWRSRFLLEAVIDLLLPRLTVVKRKHEGYRLNRSHHACVARTPRPGGLRRFVERRSKPHL